MAKLPDETNLPDPSVGISGRPIATYDTTGYAKGAAALAQGGVDIGTGLAHATRDLTIVARHQAAEDDKLELARAKSDFLTQKVNLDATLANETDHETLPDRYKTNLETIQQSAAANISNPRTRELFTLSTADDIARGNAAADKTANKLWGDATLADTTTRLETVRQAALKSSDPVERQRLIDTGNNLIESLAAKGIVTRATAAQTAQEWTTKYAAGAIAMLPPEDRVRVLGGFERTLVNKESGGDAGLVNPLGYAGLYQFGAPRLAAMGVYKPGEGEDLKTWSSTPKDAAGKWSGTFDIPGRPDVRTLNDFLASPDAQRAAFAVHSAKMDQEIKANGFDQYIGQQIGGVTITREGLQAMLHLGGVGGTRDALTGKGNAKDVNGTGVLDYAKLGSQSDLTKVAGLLHEDTRVRMLNEAQSQLYSQKAGERTAFELSMKDDLSEADRTGTVSKPKSLDDFIKVLGPQDAPAAYDSYRSGIQLGADFNSVARLDPEEQERLLKTYEPKPGAGYADAAKRQEFLAKAIEQDRKLRTRDPEFKQHIENSIAEAGRTGSATNPVTREEFEKRFGKQDGGRAFASYSASIRLGRDVQHVGEMSPEEQHALLTGYEPAAGSEDYFDTGKRYDALVKAIVQSNQEKLTDPAEFAIARLPVVQDAYDKFNAAQADATATQDTKQAAAREFAAKMEMEQTRIGVPAEQRRLLPKSYADQFNAKLANPAAGGGTLNLVAMIDNEARLWGDAWPKVYRDLAKDALPVALVIGSGIKPAAAQTLSEFAHTKLGDIANDQGEEKLSAIKKDVRDTFRPLARSMAGHEGSQPVIDAFQVAGEKLSAYYVRGGSSSADAATRAFDELLGHKYDFSGETYRVPKSVPFTPAQIASGVAGAKAKLGEIDVLPARDSIGGLTPDYLKSATARAYARDGIWTTAPDESGLALIFQDQAVRRSDGKPLVLSWADLARLGQVYDSARYDSRGGGMTAP